MVADQFPRRRVLEEPLTAGKSRLTRTQIPLQQEHVTSCGLNENSLAFIDSFIYCLIPSGTVWEGLGGVALLEEGCYWGQALGF